MSLMTTNTKSSRERERKVALSDIGPQFSLSMPDEKGSQQLARVETCVSLHTRSVQPQQ